MVLQGAAEVQGFFPSCPTVSAPAGGALTGLQYHGKMAGQKAESACFSVLSFSAKEGIDVAPGPRSGYSQTTNTN